MFLSATISVTLGTQASQPEYMAISWSVTLGTDASKLECIVMSVGDTKYRG